jgi:hypothetical protein
MTYVLLIYRASAPGTAAPLLDEADVLRAHRALQEETSRRGELHAVARLDDPSSARTVARTATAHEIMDGPFIESKEWLVGFYLLDCANEEEALARARILCPDAQHVVEVRPVKWRWRK